MFRLTALALILMLLAPFLPFDCVCCDLHAEIDCCADGVCAHHDADSSGAVTMQLNRPPSDEDREGGAHDGCFCGHGLAHALARLTSPTAIVLSPDTAIEPGFVRTGARLWAATVPASPDTSPPWRPPRR